MLRKFILVAILVFTPVFAQASTIVSETQRANIKHSIQSVKVAQTQAGFERWVKNFRAKALSRGISSKTYDRAFHGVKLHKRVIVSDRNQSEFSRQIWDYLDTATSPKRVENGKSMVKKYKRYIFICNIKEK